MVVVSIIGILAAIAIPNYSRFQCRAKQSEAKANMKSMSAALASHVHENDNQNFFLGYIDCDGNFWDFGSFGFGTTAAIGFNVTGESRYQYWYYGGLGAPTRYVGYASGCTDTVAGDFWMVDGATGEIENDFNICALD